jgi:tetratricopeptide (TPR) repeat protein
MKPILTAFLLLFFANTYAQKAAELLIRANRATLEREYSKAVILYSKYIVLNPADFRGYFNRGTTEFNAGKYADATRDFTKTLTLNPIYREAYYYRGLCQVELKQYDAAIKDYTYILLDNPRSVPFLKVRADAHNANGDEVLALADLDVAIRIDNLSGDLYKRRAELKVEMKDINGALRDYSSVEKLLPKYKMVHYIKGNLYLQIDETEFACEEYQKALDHHIVVAERSHYENCNP